MIVPRYYENLSVLHENTMPARAYYIPASKRMDNLVEHREESDRANSHFLRTAGPHSPDSPGHIKRTVLEISRAERGFRPANQYRALSQKAMPSQSVR